jgi:predicted PhzF superfamily epimerase YddE/YHI9
MRFLLQAIRLASIDLRLEQGYEIGRRSSLYLRARKEEDEISVSVGSKMQMVAKGKHLCARRSPARGDRKLVACPP